MRVGAAFLRGSVPKSDGSLTATPIRCPACMAASSTHRRDPTDHRLSGCGWTQALADTHRCGTGGRQETEASSSGPVREVWRRPLPGNASVVGRHDGDRDVYEMLRQQHV